VSFQVKAYMCVIKDEDLGVSILTARDYAELVYKATNNIFEAKKEDYPELNQFISLNSIDFILDLDDDDDCCRDNLNRLLCYLRSKGSTLTADLFELDQVINEERLLAISSDMV